MDLTLPLDQDGFLRRECPRCEREFKWFDGETEGRPTDIDDPEVYFCPLCGEPAPVDHWWTQAQLEYVQGHAVAEVSGALEDAFSEFNNSDFLRVDVSGTSETAPLPLVEVNDMDIVEPPCHPWEPVKVPEDWQEPIHCLVCGQQFVA